MSNTINKSKSPFLGLVLTFGMAMLLSCAIIVMWRLRDGSPAIFAALIGTVLATVTTLIYFFRKSSYLLSLNRFIMIVFGMVIGLLLVPKTEESVMFEALMMNKSEVFLEMPEKSSAFLENCLINNTQTFYIARLMKTTNKEFALPILLSSYSKAKDINAKLSILTIAADIEDEKVTELFLKAYQDKMNEGSFRLSVLDIATKIKSPKIVELFKESLNSSHLEEIMLATNYLMMSDTPEEDIVANLLPKIPILLDGLQTPEYRESIAMFISVFLGEESLPQLLEAAKKTPSQGIVDILARIGSKKSSPLLFKIIKETDDNGLKNKCVEALGFIIHDKTIVPFLESIRPTVEENLELHNIIEDAIENQNYYTNTSNLSSEIKSQVNDVIGKMENFIISTNCYKGKIQCKMWSQNHEDTPSVMSEMMGNIYYQKENLFSMDLESILYAQYKQRSYIFTCFDGKYQWYYIDEKKFNGRSLNKFDLAEFSFPERPFDVWPIAGTGMMPGEDFLQTIRTFMMIYDFVAVEQLEGQTKIRGKIRKDKVMQYLANTGQLQILRDQKLLDAMAKSHNEIVISIQNENVTGWEIISKQRNSVMQIMYPRWISKVEFTITDFERNQDIDSSVFAIDAGAADRAIDMGPNLSKIFNKRIQNRDKAILLVNKILQEQE